MQYNNRNFNNNPPPTNRGPAIRAGLSVQELKAMTAMRMAQTGGDAPVQGNNHNISSSYQTATPQQLQAAGIQPIVINDRQNSARVRSARPTGPLPSTQFNNYPSGSMGNPPNHAEFGSYNNTHGPPNTPVHNFPSPNVVPNNYNNRNAPNNLSTVNTNNNNNNTMNTNPSNASLSSYHQQILPKRIPPVGSGAPGQNEYLSSNNNIFPRERSNYSNNENHLLPSLGPNPGRGVSGLNNEFQLPHMHSTPTNHNTNTQTHLSSSSSSVSWDANYSDDTLDMTIPSSIAAYGGGNMNRLGRDLNHTNNLYGGSNTNNTNGRNMNGNGARSIPSLPMTNTNTNNTTMNHFDSDLLGPVGPHSNTPLTSGRRDYPEVRSAGAGPGFHLELPSNATGNTSTFFTHGNGINNHTTNTNGGGNSASSMQHYQHHTAHAVSSSSSSSFYTPDEESTFYSSFGGSRKNSVSTVSSAKLDSLASSLAQLAAGMDEKTTFSSSSSTSSTSNMSNMDTTTIPNSSSFKRPTLNKARSQPLIALEDYDRLNHGSDGLDFFGSITHTHTHVNPIPHPHSTTTGAGSMSSGGMSGMSGGGNSMNSMSGHTTASSSTTGGSGSNSGGGNGYSFHEVRLPSLQSPLTPNSLSSASQLLPLDHTPTPSHTSHTLSSSSPLELWQKPSLPSLGAGAQSPLGPLSHSSLQESGHSTSSMHLTSPPHTLGSIGSSIGGNTGGSNTGGSGSNTGGSGTGNTTPGQGRFPLLKSKTAPRLGALSPMMPGGGMSGVGGNDGVLSNLSTSPASFFNTSSSTSSKPFPSKKMFLSPAQIIRERSGSNESVDNLCHAVIDAVLDASNTTPISFTLKQNNNSHHHRGGGGGSAGSGGGSGHGVSSQGNAFFDDGMFYSIDEDDHPSHHPQRQNQKQHMLPVDNNGNHNNNSNNNNNKKFEWIVSMDDSSTSPGSLNAPNDSEDTQDEDDMMSGGHHHQQKKNQQYEEEEEEDLFLHATSSSASIYRPVVSSM